MLKFLENIFVNNFHIFSTLISAFSAVYLYRRFDISSFKEKLTVIVGTIFFIYLLSFLFGVWQPITWKTFVGIAVAIFLEKKWGKVNHVWERPLEMLAISMLFFAMFLNIKLHSFIDLADMSALKMGIFIFIAILTGFLTGVYTKPALRSRRISTFHFKRGHRILLNKIALLAIFDLIILMIFTGSEMIYLFLYIGGFGIGLINSMCEKINLKRLWDETYIFFLSILLVFAGQITHNVLIMFCSVMFLLHSIKKVEQGGKYKLADIKTVLLSYIK